MVVPNFESGADVSFAVIRVGDGDDDLDDCTDGTSSVHPASRTTAQAIAPAHNTAERARRFTDRSPSRVVSSKHRNSRLTSGYP
jgi:hypothetical protein